MKTKFAILVLILLFSNFAHAQVTQPLPLFDSVTGQLEPGISQQWTFTAPAGAVLSFSVEPLSGGLDPVLSVTNSAGNVVFQNDDYDYPTSPDALLQAVTVPLTDTYTLTVAGYGGTAGDYELRMLPGFAQPMYSDDFSGELDWQAIQSGLTLGIVGERLMLTVAGAQQTGIAVNPAHEAVSNFYTSVDVAVLNRPSNWRLGIVARQQAGSGYYLLEINEQGQWRFTLQNAQGENVLRNWTPHPALIAGRQDFNLGLLAMRDGLEFFYDGQLFGSATDTSLTDAGQVGLMAGTGSTPQDNLMVQFDNLRVTVPVMIENGPLLPPEISTNNAARTVQEIQRHGLVAANGTLALTVPESFVQSMRPGVSPFMLGGGVTFSNLAIATTMTWETSGIGATGCGLLLRVADETRYTVAYIDQTGAYGVSRREGGEFLPGIFGQSATFSGTTHHLLVIADGENLFYYVDGRYVGRLGSTVIDGQVGNAVVNFEPIATSCNFTDTWLYQWR